MKKIILLAAILTFNMFAFGQVLPSFQLGVKAGMNLSKFSTDNPFSSDNRAGYYGGIWTRIGGAGLHLQPEAYLTGKNTILKENSSGSENDVNFTSLDVPILLGTKLGAAGIGLRLNTGPVVSFIFDQEQNPKNAVNDTFKGRFKDQFYAWQFGAGLDIGTIGVDLRYETGLSKIGEAGYDNTKLSLFTLGLSFKLF